MTKEMAMFLVECSENAGNEASLREDYSGRGMYGRTTCGVVVDSQVQLLADVIAWVNEQIGEEVSEVYSRGVIDTWNGGKIPDVSSFSVDNMGNQTILY
jgi:hypothetical protein